MVQLTRALAVLAVVVSHGACKEDGKTSAGEPVPTGPSPVGEAVVTAAGRDPCALITPDEVGAAIGTPVIKTTPYRGIECRWTVKPLPSHPKEIDPWVAVSFHNDMAMREVEAAPGTNGVVPIAGLGDRAYRGNSFHHLWVKHGSDVFVAKSRLIGFTERSEATLVVTDDIEVRLARLVLTKL